MALPRLIALCGNPKSGKSTAQSLLANMFNYMPVDDGKPLREIAQKYLGLTYNQVYTQDGKLETVRLNGRDWTCREVLGEIGNAFEEKFGGDIIPIMSFNLMEPGQRYVLGSVRREQGLYWARKGAMVIEMINPDAAPSPYEFDRYSTEPVYCQIINDGLSRGLSALEATRDLREKLKAVISR